MAVLDASQSSVGFSSDVGFDSSYLTQPDAFGWLTLGTSSNPADAVVATGTGFTYSGAVPTSGTATAVTHYGEDSVADWTLTGISAPLTQLVTPGNYQLSNIRFWETVLSGNDTIIAPITQGGTLFGDFTNVTVEPGSFTEVTRTGGNDTFSAHVVGTASIIVRGDGPALVGDALFASGQEEELNGVPVAYSGTVNGGDDVFTLTGGSRFLVVGDVRNVGVLGVVNGGDDLVNSSVEGFSAFGLTAAAYAGDVEGNSGFVNGGDDTILGSNFPFIAERIIGDAVENFIGGFLMGGDDRLLGRAGQDFIAGDVYDLNGGSVSGGADLIRGGEDSDIIAGDVFHSRPGVGLAVFTLTGGADEIDGEGGNDWIAGDMWDMTEIDPASALIGGNDLLFGGSGDDTLNGDYGGSTVGLNATGGNDTLDGGAGIDRLIGGDGNDVYLNVVGDTIVEEAGGGIDTIRSAVTETLAGRANVENLTLTGSDGIGGTGNGLDNLITGNGGPNALSGLTGNDTLQGGAGADTLVGAAGNDQMRGGTDADSMNGGVGNDSYWVDRADDVVVELAGEGTDTVYATVNWTLGAQFEILRQQGSTDLTGSGNGANNRLYGNDGANRLLGQGGNDIVEGGGGADTLNGGEGNDTMNGGAAADVFRFATSNTGNDLITGYQPSVDRFDLLGGSFTNLLIAPNGDSILTHAGGKVRIEGISNLTLAQWNARVLPAGAGASPAADSHLAPAQDDAGLALSAHAQSFVIQVDVGWIFA